MRFHLTLDIVFWDMVNVLLRCTFLNSFSRTLILPHALEYIHNHFFLKDNVKILLTHLFSFYFEKFLKNITQISQKDILLLQLIRIIIIVIRIIVVQCISDCTMHVAQLNCNDTKVNARGSS